MSDPQNPLIWLSGAFVKLDQARISPLDRGFLFGDGLFETIRAENGGPLYMRLHLDRLNNSLSALRIRIATAPEWERIIERLLAENEINSGAAAVKIIVSRGVDPQPGTPESRNPTVCVTARRYSPPSPDTYKRGWRLGVFGDFPPPLAMHKTLNYLYYQAARQAALDDGLDDSVIVDRDGSVCETSSGALLAASQGVWWTPESRLRLPSTTLQALSAILGGEGIRIERRRAALDDLLEAETVWVLNSLIGIMPIAEISGRAVNDPAPKKAAELRELLFQLGR